MLLQSCRPQQHAARLHSQCSIRSRAADQGLAAATQTRFGGQQQQQSGQQAVGKLCAALSISLAIASSCYAEPSSHDCYVSGGPQLQKRKSDKLRSQARDLLDAGQAAQAVPLLNEALRIDEVELGPDDPSVARVLCDLAQVRCTYCCLSMSMLH